ncbi:alpha/beta hydrolase family protein [Streptomyces hawaiiensis]|uniref:alpha/beta hydrolase family protein n=1 Tax=Streptomyces hawaiiensis TaxID=67305 RepID=UPI00364C4141
MSLAEDLFTERDRHLFAWHDGPVLGSVGPDGRLDVIETDRRGGHRVLCRPDLDADAVLFLGARQAVARLSVRDDGRLTVTETTLDGKETHRRADLPAAAAGAWTLLDVLETACDTLVLTVEDDAGNRRFLDVAPSGRVRARRFLDAPPGEPVHWNAELDVAVLAQDRGPWPPLLRLCAPSSGRVAASVIGRWLDGEGGTGAVLADRTDTGTEPTLSLWDLGDGSLTPLPSRGWTDDARFLRDGTGGLLAVRTEEATDRLDLVDPADGSARPIAPHLPGAGRLRIRVANRTGIGVYALSTLTGSSWHWITPGGAVASSPGRIPAHAGGATRRHHRLGPAPALVYAPARDPVAMVVSLHGGPESIERDELRWDGLYRELLDAGILVVGLNYAGSVGYGSQHRRRPWSDWRAAFRGDLDACVAEARARGLGPGDIALLGGSFGGALALLGCVLDGRLAGAVACAPLVDLRRHVNRAVVADARYRSWFEQRFGLAPDTTDPHPDFDPARLSATGDRPVFLIHGDQDEVVDGQDTARAAALARAQGRPWTLIREDGIGHVPQNPEQAARRYAHVRSALHSVLGHKIR